MISKLFRDEAIALAKQFLISIGYFEKLIYPNPLVGEIIDTVEGISKPAWSVFFAIDWGDPSIIASDNALVIIQMSDRSCRLRGYNDSNR
jgi:hypothetical protein